MSADRFQRIMGLAVLLTLLLIVGVALAPLWVQKVFVVAFTLIFLTGLLTSFRSACRVVREVSVEERTARRLERQSKRSSVVETRSGGFR